MARPSTGFQIMFLARIEGAYWIRRQNSTLSEGEATDNANQKLYLEDYIKDHEE